LSRLCSARLFTLGALAGGPALFKALGGEGASLANAVLYSNLVFGAAVPIWITNLLASALRGAGNVKVPAILTAAGAVLTLALSPPLILGWGPLPRLGVAGAGYAMILYYSARRSRSSSSCVRPPRPCGSSSAASNGAC
jgi:Na+-driven multidrug efflux pump